MKRFIPEERQVSKRRKTNVVLQSVPEVFMRLGVLESVILFLDIRSVARSIQMHSKTWKNNVNRERIGRSLCARLWSRKAYICPRSILRHGRVCWLHAADDVPPRCLTF